AGVYTCLKPRSELNTWVGAVVGAVPPLIGWAAAGESLLFPTEPWLLGLSIYLWQFPHFFALAWRHRADYARGGFAMIPCNDPKGDRTAALISRYSVYALSIPLLAVSTGATTPMCPKSS
ncbi:MAG: UbiA family prenyltransferase, partial [Pseudomonadota bacterium]